MTTEAADTAVLVLRVWREAGSASGVRTRITAQLDLLSPVRQEVVCDAIETVAETVVRLLTEFAAPSPPPPPGSGTPGEGHGS
jgi:hypothetical protein